jgi:hypothetical protein
MNYAKGLRLNYIVERLKNQELIVGHENKRNDQGDSTDGEQLK